MQKFDYYRDQHLFEMRIGIEKPVVEFTQSFFQRGVGYVGHPQISVGPDYEAFPAPALMVAGDTVPFICLSKGLVRFGAAKWGIPDPKHDTVEFLRNWESRSYAFTGLIPASFVDLAVNENNPEGDVSAVRVQARDGCDLFVACAYKPDQLCRAAFVTPFICGAGAELKRYVSWQPLLITMGRGPSIENFDFIARRDNGRRHLPSPWGGTLKVEPIMQNEAEALDQARS